jgi:hypothetical protein
MEGAEWAKLEAAVLAETGTLPDGTVEGVAIDGWQRLLDLIRGRGWPSEFQVDGEIRPLPAAAEDLFLPDALGTLAVWVSRAIRINVFPYSVDDICFDFDTREIGGGGLQVVGEFTRDVGRCVQRQVKLSHEGDGTGVFLTYDPANDTFSSRL